MVVMYHQKGKMGVYLSTLLVVIVINIFDEAFFPYVATIEGMTEELFNNSLEIITLLLFFLVFMQEWKFTKSYQELADQNLKKEEQLRS